MVVPAFFGSGAISRTTLAHFETLNVLRFHVKALGLLPVDPELAKNSAVDGDLEHGADGQLDGRVISGIVLGLVEITEEPHEYQDHRKPDGIFLLEIESELGEAQESLDAAGEGPDDGAVGLVGIEHHGCEQAEEGH